MQTKELNFDVAKLCQSNFVLMENLHPYCEKYEYTVVLHMYWDAPIISFGFLQRDKIANITTYGPGGDCHKCVPPYDFICLFYIDEAVHGFEY